MSGKSEVYNRLAQKDKALKAIREAYEYNGNNIVTINNYALILNDLGKYHESIKLFNSGIDLNPFYLPFYINLSNSYTKLGDGRKSLEALKTALKYDKNYIPAYKNLAFAGRERGDLKGAVDILNYAVTLDSSDRELKLSLADLYFKMDAFDMAGEVYRGMLGKDPAAKEALMGLAQIAGVRRDYAASNGYLEEIKKLDQKFFSLYYMMGINSKNTGDPVKAMEFMRKELELHPGNLKAGEILSQMNKP